MITEKDILNRIEKEEIKLLGLIEISEEEYKELLSYSKVFIRNVSPSYGVKCDLKLSVTLVQVAIREYKEGKFWTHFCDAIDDIVSLNKMNYCGQVFEKTVKRYNMLYVDYGDTHMYVENIKMHAIVTNYYMAGMWEFLSSYYEKNLFRQLTEDIEEDLDYLAIFMKQTLESNSDSFANEDSKGKAAKTYKLLKATRYLIAFNDSHTNSEILLPLLRIIDSYYYDTIFPSSLDRFGKSFIEWCNAKEGEVEHGDKNDKQSLVSRRPNIRYDINTMSAFLIIPPQKFRDTEFDGEASAKITIDGYTEEFHLEIYKSFGVFISEAKRVPIPSLFDEISITVESSITKKYKIKGSNYRLMNKNYEVIGKLALGENMIFVQKGTKVSFEGETRCVDTSEDLGDFDYYSVIVSEDSILHFGNRVISLAGEYSEQPYFDDEVFDFEVFDVDNNRLVVSRTHPVVSFVVSEKKYAGTVIWVNGKKLPLADIANKFTSRTSNQSDLAITIALENELGTTDGAYEIIIDIPDEKNKKVPKYVRLSNLEVYTSKSIFAAQEQVYVWVKNGGEFIWPEREDVCLAAIQAKGEEYLVPVCGDEEDVIFYLELNEVLRLRLPLYLLKAGFSPEHMTFSQPEYIWYSDLKETLYCSAPAMEELRIYLNHDKSNYIQGINIKNGIFRVDISELKNQIVKDTTEGWQYINVICIGERRRSFHLLSVMRFLWIDPYFDFKMVDGKLAFELDVKGNADLYVDIVDERTKKTVIQSKPIRSGITMLPELDGDGLYSIYPRMEEGDFFGIDVTTTKLRPLFEQSFVTLDDLRNYRLQIGDLLFDEERKTLSYDYFIDLRDQVDDKTYLGYMYGLKKAPRQRNGIKSGKYELNSEGKPVKKKFGKVKVEIVKIDEKSIILKVLTSSYDEAEEEWVELYYDNVSKTLLHPNDNAVSKGTNYSRFDYLDNDCTSYRVMRKKIRRLNYYAV